MSDFRQYISDRLESLSVRLLGGIFFVFFLAMVMVLFGIWTYQRDKFVTLTSQRAVQLSDVIVAGLRSTMLQNDRKETMSSISNMLRAGGTERISILNDQSKVVMTSDPDLSGKIVDKMFNPSCRECHLSGKRLERTAVVEVNGERFINTVTSIRNEPACHSCHSPGKKIIGVLLVESSFHETEVMLKEMTWRIILTGVFTFLAGAFFLSYIVRRFFTRPMKVLQKGFEHVGHGDFSYWVDVDCSGELSYMADSFNVMSRAIGRFVNEIEEKKEEVGAHYSIVNSLSQTIDKKKLKEVVVVLLYRLLKADCASLALAVENHPDMFEIVRMRRADKRQYYCYYNIESGDLDACALTREDLRNWREGIRPSVSYSENCSKLLMSLVHKNMDLGVVSVVKPGEQTFSEAEKKIIPVMAHHISLSLANAQLYNIAITDGLTTLYSKRHFEKKISDFVHDYRTTKTGFCLLILDLDHFKQVNDAHGHPVGDKVLVEIADLIRSATRHGDIAFRYGGEEFAILLKGEDVERAVRIAERVRQSVEKKVLRINDIAPFSKTVSIGVACFPHHCSSQEGIINAADKAMYKAKNMGRNRVEVYSPAE